METQNLTASDAASLARALETEAAACIAKASKAVRLFAKNENALSARLCLGYADQAWIAAIAALVA